MRCRCGNEIKNVPEHLRGLANWMCQQCTNQAPRSSTVSTTAEKPEQKATTAGQRKKEAA